MWGLCYGQQFPAARIVFGKDPPESGGRIVAQALPLKSLLIPILRNSNISPTSSHQVLANMLADILVAFFLDIQLVDFPHYLATPPYANSPR
jgi:hypothetical protein